jgi:hypothetical protein
MLNLLVLGGAVFAQLDFENQHLAAQESDGEKKEAEATGPRPQDDHTTK